MNAVKTIEERTISAGGVETHVLSAGQSGDNILFLHGGIPGVTPYCDGTHLWRDTIDAFASEARATVFDLLGSGRTGWGKGALSVDRMGEHVLATIDALGLARCHVVGHHLGGLLALWLGKAAPDRVQSISVVASMPASPTGDWIDDIVFQSPPRPLWSEYSQRWALNRISYTSHHVDQALLRECVAASEQEGTRQAREHMAGAQARAAFTASMNRTKAQLWSMSRDERFPKPVQMIWAAQDPLSTPSHGLTLFRTLGQHQPEAQFHLIDEAGSFVFREQPVRFRRLVEAFRLGLAETLEQYRYA